MNKEQQFQVKINELTAAKGAENGLGLGWNSDEYGFFSGAYGYFNAFLPNTSSTSTTLPVTWVDVQEGVDSVNTTRPDNIKGQVTCSGVGVPGVVVTDGYAVTTTDADGIYKSMQLKYGCGSDVTQMVWINER